MLKHSMFKSIELMFKSSELKFKSTELMFKSIEHRFLPCLYKIETPYRTKFILYGV